MATMQPTYELKNAEDLNKFLYGTLRDIRKKEITVEEAGAISQVADKIIKNNLTRIMYKKLTNSSAPIQELEPTVNQTLMQSV